jgi:hypothetical protein
VTRSGDCGLCYGTGKLSQCELCEEWTESCRCEPGPVEVWVSCRDCDHGWARDSWADQQADAGLAAYKERRDEELLNRRKP